MTTPLRLGLIGDAIAPSRAPDLHHACGALTGIELRYDRFSPPALGQSFETVWHSARATCAGVNITLPYKERVLAHLDHIDPTAARIGAVNTVRFDADGARGFNTDHSGFVAACRAALDTPPGRVALIGAGGVGKAIAYGLRDLGAAEIVLIDTNDRTAAALATALGPTARIGTLADLASSDSVINATPLGMADYPGSPVPADGFPPARWAFDAVYTPLNTVFRAQALAAGAQFVSGVELFLHQGLRAFEIFTDQPAPNVETLRNTLNL